MQKVTLAKNLVSIIFKFKYPLALIGIYFLFFLWINPLKQPNYIVGDEWSSFRQIEAFQNGIFRLNGAKDTSFILQGVLAYALTFIISDNFLAVRLLNFFVSFAFLMGVFCLSKMLLRDEKKSFLLTLLVVFNPLVYFLSFTFYSEIYLLTLLVWAFYFFGKFYETENKRLKLVFLMIAGVLSGATVLVRQQGIILPAVFVLLYLLQNSNFKIKEVWKLLIQKNILLFSLIVGSFILVYGLWPVYIEWNREHLFSGFVKLMNKKSSEFRLTDYAPYFMGLFYLSFFTFPLLRREKLKIRGLLVATIFSWFAFQNNNFPIGDIFSLNGYIVKDFQISPNSVFNNTLSKILISTIQGFGLFYLAITLKKVFQSIKSFSQVQILILASSVLLLLSNFLIADVYDRYLVVPFVLLFFVLLIKFDFSFKFVSQITFLILIIISTVMVYEFVQTRQVSSALALQNPENVSKLSKIWVSEEFGKYHKSRETNDFSGLIYPRPENKYRCEVRKIYKVSADKSDFISVFLKEYLKLPDPPKLDSERLVSSKFIIEPSNSFLGYQTFVNLYCK